MSCIQNYRGIALCTLILKVFEYTLLLKYNDKLLSGDHQFAYKSKLSTTMCTWAARETIAHYNRNGSSVFACLLDCSKAFDKIRYDVLFPKLLDKGVPPIIVRFILYSYLNSQIKIKWNGAESEPFNVLNGVRQGAVLSPFLFNIYVDGIISELKREGLGCWIGDTYYGALIYADDITLLSPTVYSLQRMINICERFGANVGLQFNAKKTVCIEFHESVKCSDNIKEPDIFLNGNKIEWSKHVKHLGHTLSCCLSSDKDIDLKKGKFIGCVNNIATEFQFAHPVTKAKLLQIYGCSFYGSNLWNFYGFSCDRLYKTWNISLRKLFKLPPQAHTRYLDVICNVRHIRFSLKLRFLSFIQTLFRTNNQLISNLIECASLHHLSPTGLVLSNVLREYDICDLHDIRCVVHNLRDCMLKRYETFHRLNDEELSYCQVVRELIDCINDRKESHLLKSECYEMIAALTTL
jgi:hypothetical protein